MSENDNPIKRLRQISREYMRAMLIDAIAGSPSDRMFYCVRRSAQHQYAQLIIHGGTLTTPEIEYRQAMLVFHQFNRLERIAKTARDQTTSIDDLADRCCCECGEYFEGTTNDDYCFDCWEKLYP